MPKQKVKAKATAIAVKPSIDNDHAGHGQLNNSKSTSVIKPRKEGKPGIQGSKSLGASVGRAREKSSQRAKSLTVHANDQAIVDVQQEHPDTSASNELAKKQALKKAARRRRGGDIVLDRSATIEVVMKYQLGQYELKKFRLCFQQIDLDSSGMIDYEEFFEFIDENKTPFSLSLFKMIDSDANGSIDYEEFVHATVLYCMYTRDEILHFAFDAFDPNHTGSIGEKEFKALIDVVNDGRPVFPGNLKNALSEFDRNKDGVLDFEEFKLMNKRFPILLFPCFRLQDRMQKATLGERHWHVLHKRLYNRLKLEIYQRKHNGASPPLSFFGSIKKVLGIGRIRVYEP